MSMLCEPCQHLLEVKSYWTSFNWVETTKRANLINFNPFQSSESEKCLKKMFLFCLDGVHEYWIHFVEFVTYIKKLDNQTI